MAQHGDPGRPLSAIPSVRARVLAFAAIVVAGVAGGLIGYAFVRLQCHGNCATPEGLGGVIGAAMAAGGVAVVAVLTLRAMGEWKTIKAERAAAEAEAMNQPPPPPPVPPPPGPG